MPHGNMRLGSVVVFLLLAASASASGIVASQQPDCEGHGGSSGSTTAALSSEKVVVPPVGVSSSCPPPQLMPLSDFNLLSYIAAPWYIQQQIPLDYQPADELYCVRAEYEPIDRNNISGTLEAIIPGARAYNSWYSWQAGLVVNNYANKGRVNGPTRGSSKYDRTNSSRLVAFPATPGAGARDGKLLVGPEILLTLLPGDAWRAAFGPYWVVAVGPSLNRTIGYDWAIISGGPPTYKNPDGYGCSSRAYTNATTQNNTTAVMGASIPVEAVSPPTTGGRPSFAVTGGAAAGNSSGGGNYFAMGAPPASFDRGGLWFFSRKPIDPLSTARMQLKALELGFDISQQLPVVQAGCLYQF